MFKLLVGLVAGAASSWSASSAAVPMPDPVAVARPEERALLPEFAQASAIYHSGKTAEALVAIDKLLVKLGQPTPLRGMAALARATVLADLRRSGEARMAIDEALRLLPGYSLPKFIGASIYAYTHNPQRAADLWLAVSREDPPLALTTPALFVDGLINRLSSSSDQRRADLLRERLVEIGYSKGPPSGRSSLALAAIKGKYRRGDLDGARSLIPSLANPRDLAELLIDARYRELWPSIEAWAGSDLSKQWAAYRDELKREWEASNDFEAGTAYARALAAQGDYRTVVATFLPFLSTDLPSPPPHGFEYLASPVSRSLSAVGRHDEGLALLRRLEAMVPPDQDVQRLNFSANIAREQLAAGRPAEALASIEQSLQQARRHGEAVNVSALVSMHNVRACALHGLGRGADAADSIAYVTAHQGGHLATYISLLACLGRKDDARNFLITALADDGQRSAALFFVQPNTFVPRTDYQVSLDRFRRGLITDLEVIATAKRYGRILAFPLPLTGG